MNKDNLHIKVSLTSNPYEIVIGKSSLECLGDELCKIGFKDGLKVLIVSNKEVSDHYSDCIIKSLIKNKFNPKLLILKAGEEQKNQTSFYSNLKELVGRKLKKNLKMGQILHPRHLFEKFDVNNGDIISIVSNVGNASVIVSGEAQDSGNLNDLIKVKNLESGKIVKGYIKKNKIIKIFR